MDTERTKYNWMQTYTGKQFWPLNPIIEDINIEDIAHALSMQCRYGGHVRKFYSVAEHSVLVSENVPPKDALWGLLHDATEAYLVDVPRPVKRQLSEYATIERNLMDAICLCFGLDYEMPDSVKAADNSILMDEREELMSTPPADWGYNEPPLGIIMPCWPPCEAKINFLRRYARLVVERGEHERNN
jgi:hypothetical protein